MLSDAPSCTILASQELIRFRDIGNLVPVPEQVFPRAQGDVAEQHGPGDQTGDVEIGARGFTSLRS